jgi:glycosyltransferase involved in cell wall biosynthesis
MKHGQRVEKALRESSCEPAWHSGRPSSESDRLRVLVSAYACEPGFGSEPGIGWNTVRELSREFDVCVVTRSSNRARIEAEDFRGFSRVPRFYYHDLDRRARFWKRGRRGAQLYYLLWQETLAAKIPRLLEEGPFDVAQHITFGRYWVPTPLIDTGLPLVFGPLGGADSVPATFRPALSARGRCFNAAREAMRAFAELRPRLRSCISGAAITMGTTGATVEALQRLGGRDVRLEPAVGLPDAEIISMGSRESPRTDPVRFVVAGALLAWKGFDLALRAFAAARTELRDCELHIIGDGPERAYLESLARRLALDDSVSWHGQQPRPSALRLMGESHALVHPSYHDSGGWVCLEAMALGLPVVCLDLAGPAVLVPHEAGRRIPATTPPETIAMLARSLVELGSDRDLREALGREGRKHVASQFSWSHRGKVLRAICLEASGRAEMTA